MLAFTLAGTNAEEPPLHVMLNMTPRPEAFALPELPRVEWKLAVDTGQQPWVQPAADSAPSVAKSYNAIAHSIVILEGHRT